MKVVSNEKKLKRHLKGKVKDPALIEKKENKKISAPKIEF